MSPLQSGLDNDQGSMRRNATLFDQHVSPEYPKGRPWHASIDKKSGAPVGLVTPKGWTAPWLPGQSYFTFNEEEPNRFLIDYDKLLKERLDAQAEYQANLETEAIKRGWNPADPEKAAALSLIVGKPPLPAEPVAAAMQGNRWILGLTTKVDPRLASYVTKSDRRSKLLANLPDFSDTEEEYGASGILDDQEPDDELEKLLDLEEEIDPKATGGKRIGKSKAA